MRNARETLLQFGSGPTGPGAWLNFDASPTLRLQRLPIFGGIARRILKPHFSSNILYGDVTRRLPVKTASVSAVYCSHVLEHLSLEDCRKALSEAHRILVPGGIFRGVLPDLGAEIAIYIQDNKSDASIRFMERTLLGEAQRPDNVAKRIRSLFGNARHLWMWDFDGIYNELDKAGFVDVRRADFGDSQVASFSTVEDELRWRGALGFQCKKPA